MRANETILVSSFLISLQRLSRWQLGNEAAAAVSGGGGSSVKRPGFLEGKNDHTKFYILKTLITCSYYLKIIHI